MPPELIISFLLLTLIVFNLGFLAENRVSFAFTN